MKKREVQTALMMFTSRHREGDSWMATDTETEESTLIEPTDEQLKRMYEDEDGILNQTRKTNRHNSEGKQHGKKATKRNT